MAAARPPLERSPNFRGVSLKLVLDTPVPIKQLSQILPRRCSFSLPSAEDLIQATQHGGHGGCDSPRRRPLSYSAPSSSSQAAPPDDTPTPRSKSAPSSLRKKLTRQRSVVSLVHFFKPGYKSKSKSKRRQRPQGPDCEDIDLGWTDPQLFLYLSGGYKMQPKVVSSLWDSLVDTYHGTRLQTLHIFSAYLASRGWSWTAR